MVAVEHIHSFHVCRDWRVGPVALCIGLKLASLAYVKHDWLAILQTSLDLVVDRVARIVDSNQRVLNGVQLRPRKLIGDFHIGFDLKPLVP